MAVPIKITVGDMQLEGEFFDTPCGKALSAVLPIDAIPNTWGDEFYFATTVKWGLDETATGKVAVGDIGYWPPMNALAIFFGPTPMSTGTDPVPASEVNCVGRIKGDATVLRKAKGARKILIQRC